MSKLSSTLKITFRLLAQAAGAETRRPNTVDALRALLTQTESGAGRWLREAGLVEAELPEPEGDGQATIFTEPLRKSIELAGILSMDDRRCGTQHFLLALARLPDCPVADWLRQHSPSLTLEQMGDFQDPPEPVPTQPRVWGHRLAWTFNIALAVWFSQFVTDLPPVSAFLSFAVMLYLPNLMMSFASVRAYPKDQEKCPRCARPRDLQAMFHDDTGLCRPCARSLARLPGYRYLGVLTALAALSLFSSLAANLLLVFLLQIVATLVHELGHAVAGILGGRRLLSLHLGRGDLHWSGQVGRLWLYFHLPTLGGLALAVRGQGQGRLASILFVLGGPAANLLMLVLFWPSFLALADWNLSTVWESGISPVFTFFLINLCMAVNNLYPAYITLDGGKLIGTDGRQALDLMKAPKHHSAEVIQAVLLAQSRMFHHYGNPRAELELLREAGRFVPLERYMRMHQIMLMVKLGEVTEAERLYQEIGPLTGEALPEQQSLEDNYRAWLDLHHRRLESAEKLSARSVELLPCSANKDTRGHVLLELDRLDEAESLLWEATRQTHEADSAATSLRALARLNQKRGHQAEAQKLSVLADQLAPEA